jgi:hypothetical protein
MLQIKASVGTLTADNLKLPTETYDLGKHYSDVRGKWIGFSEDDARYKIGPAPPPPAR